MTRVRGHGLSVDPPSGWEVSIYRRAGDDPALARSEVGEGGTTNPVLHVATVPLSEGRGDYGSTVVERLGDLDAFVALVEFDPDAASTALFATSPVPRSLRAGAFAGHTLQRVIAGQGGLQAFASEGGRAFCLYAVLGSLRARTTVVPRINEALGTLEVDSR